MGTAKDASNPLCREFSGTNDSSDEEPTNKDWDLDQQDPTKGRETLSSEKTAKDGHSQPQAVNSYLWHEDPRLQGNLEDIYDDTDIPAPVDIETIQNHVAKEDSGNQTHDRMPLTRLNVSQENVPQVAPASGDFEAQEVELAVYPPMTNALTLKQLPTSNEMVLFRLNSKGATQEVARQDIQLLTAEQLSSNWPEVQEAMLRELQAWAKLGHLSRRPRRSSDNIVEMRWIIKAAESDQVACSSRGEGRTSEAPSRGCEPNS